MTDFFAIVTCGRCMGKGCDDCDGQGVRHTSITVANHDLCAIERLKEEGIIILHRSNYYEVLRTNA